MRARDIPLAHTPPGGWHGEMPPPVLVGCDGPLVPGAPDLRGRWRLVSIETELAESSRGVARLIEAARPGRAHRAGRRRLCVTSKPVIHDMHADGTVENGVNDVDPQGRPISVVCTYEDGVQVLRPVGIDVEVTRRLDGDQLVWTYGPLAHFSMAFVDGKTTFVTGQFVPFAGGWA